MRGVLRFGPILGGVVGLVAGGIAIYQVLAGESATTLAIVALGILVVSLLLYVFTDGPGGDGGGGTTVVIENLNVQNIFQLGAVNQAVPGNVPPGAPTESPHG